MKKGRRKAKDSVNWTEARRYYLQNDVSYQDVADKFGTTKARVAEHARAGPDKKGWVLMKSELKDRIDTQTEQKFVERQVKSNVENLNSVYMVAEDLITKANEAVGELNNHLVKSKTKKKKTKYSNAKGRTNKALSETVTEEEKIKFVQGDVNTKKMKDIATVIEKAKNIFIEQPSEDNGSGVIIMPEQEELTPPTEDEGILNE